MGAPGMANNHFSMLKTFDLYERFSAQFRAEVFNLTNTPQFSGPNARFGASNFGQITRANFPGVFHLDFRFFL